MKKTPLALALLGALSVPAFAQSSVTLFGIVDLSVNQTRNAGTTTTTMQGSQLNSSRLGFKGLEDLGGGLKAGFHLEAGVNPDDGTTNSPQFFNRRSTVMLMGPFGELRLGRDYLPTFWNMAFFDAYGANGYGQLENITSVLGTAVDKYRVNNEVEYLLPGNLGVERMPARQGQRFKAVGAAHHLVAQRRQHPAQRAGQVEIVFDQQDVHAEMVSDAPSRCHRETRRELRKQLEIQRVVPAWA